MATGLGKTFLAALDAKRFAGEKGRVLFIVHQKDILEQAKEAFYSVFGNKATYGYYHGFRKDKKKQIMFATFQTLFKKKSKFKPEEFDYVVVDETHHAQATTYRPVVTYFKPKFMLGITATPDRRDGLKISELYENNIPYQMDLIKALSRGYLAPVEYEIFSSNLDDFSIKEAGQKYTIKDLNRYLFIPRRDEEIAKLFYEKIKKIKNAKALVFCPNIKYAERMKKYFADSVVVHANSGAETRREAISAFKDGKYKVIFTVNLFNEGVDIPDVNVIVFLRSTVSYTIFYQQLGRGLRKSVGKEKVTVLDFVANYDRVKILYDLKAKLKDELAEERKHGDRVPKEDYFWNTNVKFTQENADIFKILERFEADRAKPHGYWTEEKLLAELEILCKNLGRFPTQSYLYTCGRSDLMHGINRLGGAHYFAEKLAYVLSQKPKNYWNEESVLAELRPICKKLDKFPTREFLESIGRYDLNSAMSKRGGLHRFAEKLGYTISKKSDYYWSEEKVLEELRAICKNTGSFPTQKYLRNSGRFDLMHAIDKRDGLYYFAEKLGYTLSQKPVGYWSAEKVTAELKPICKKLGKFPTREYLRNSGRSDLDNAMNQHDGLHYFAKQLGYTLSEKPKNYWNEGSVIAELRLICKKLGNFPTMVYIVKTGNSSLPQYVAKLGGVTYFAKKLGYERKGRDWIKI